MIKVNRDIVQFEPDIKFYIFCMELHEIVSFIFDNTKYMNDHSKKVIKIRKYSSKERFNKFKPVTRIVSSNKRIEIQTYGVWLEYDEIFKPLITIRLANLEVLENGKINQYTFDELKAFKGMTRIYGYMSGYYTNSELYEFNPYKDLVHSELKYLDFEKIFINIKKNAYDIVDVLKTIYKYKHLIEMLQKNKLDLLVNDVINKQVDLRTLTKGRLIKHRKYLRDFGGKQFKIWVYINERGYQLNQKCMPFLDEVISKIPQNYNLNRLQEYLINQNYKLSYWLDYENMMNKIGTPLTDATMYPKSLEKAHDEAVEKFNMLKQEMENKNYHKRIKKLKKYEFKYNSLMVKVPEELQDILTEGKELHHCVGSYLDAISSGSKTILFVRKKDDKPYYTLEMQGRRLVQCRGKYNKNYKESDEVRIFINNYLNYLEKPNKKEQR